MKSLTLSIVTIMLHLVGKAYAATDGGICGTDCNWVFDTETKTLTITGTKQSTYSPKKDDEGIWHTTAPWVKYEKQIEHAVVADTFDKIGTHSFYCFGNLQDVIFPKNLKIIEDQTFHNTKLTTVEIPNTVTEIGVAAFQSTRLKNVVIPNSVQTIGDYAFDDIRTLESVVIGDGVISVGSKAFRNLSADAKIYCQDTREHQCDEIINDTTGGTNNIVKYKKDIYGQIIADGKIYSSMEKLAKGIEVKRIYSIEEASKLSKPVGNTFRIRYR